MAEVQDQEAIPISKRKLCCSISILLFVNLLNYMDRFTVAGVLDEIQKDFNISDHRGGLLQAALIVFYMLFRPLFGYLGDRYSRRWLMAFGVTLWSLTTLCGSFMTNYWWFLLFRAMVGIGEASYSTIARTIISDLFVGGMRSKMLALFNFAIPVGSGLGCIVGAKTENLLGSWHWALRVTPVLGVVAVAVIILFLAEPERGASEGSGHMESTPWCEDLKDIVKNRTFMLYTAGFTCVAFVAGALSWWVPKYLEMASALRNHGKKDPIAFKFGVIAMMSGLTGVPTGALVSQKLKRICPRIDAYLCAFGLIVSCPFIIFALYSAYSLYDMTQCFITVFFGMFFLNLTWSIVADILLYVTSPVRRSTAEGFQLLISHALGDAGGPYIVGVISYALHQLMRTLSEHMEEDMEDMDEDMDEEEQDAMFALNLLTTFHSLQIALYITCFVEVLGGLFFLICACFIVKDRERVSMAIRDKHGIEYKEALVPESYFE